MRICTYQNGERYEQPDYAPCMPWAGWPDNPLIGDVVDIDYSVEVDVHARAPFPWWLLLIAGALVLAANRKG